MNLIDKITRKWVHIRLQPIHVYCLHHVCKQFDAEWMHESDWMEIEEFKCKVLALRQRGIEFISLTEAHHRLTLASSPLTFRLKRYAVLTFDDGYASLREVLPWLQEQDIPVTLFFNPDYAAGKAYRNTPKEQYLTTEELSEFAHTPHTPLVEIGMHGMQHVDVSKMTFIEITNYAKETIAETSKIDGHIPFWAYTWGKHNEVTDKLLKKYNLIPVLMDGMKNYNDSTCIHRELLI